ncbi:hypothetical protein B7463_g491, partial [Scytalidium lignicola]
MIVTRQCEEVRTPWSSSKLEAIYHSAASPRMPNFEPLQTQQDWREQYSPFSLPGENGLLQTHFDQSATSNGTNSHPSELQGAARPILGHRQSLGSLGLRQGAQPAPIVERPGSAPGDCERSVDSGIRDESQVSTESTALSLTSNPLSSSSSAPMQLGLHPGNVDEGSMQPEVKDEDDDEEDDDEILETEEGATQQTAAERRAERRKMKRFRLTHQQTRFLMSEFAKQAHPDAAHRERLSREIPGLSPRQVQVWFQNRRAKIKRLTADDRERMMKMRAVPDDFDNVQALHSPYGAVHGISTPLQSPADFAPSYADHLMRPMMMDTIRRENDDHLSPSGLTPSFAHAGFPSPGSLNSPDILSPLSLNSAERYYSSHLSGSLSGGPRSANLFDRQNATSNYHGIQNLRRPLQPLHLRETISRTRSESLHSPLRTSMSWKGESLDYGNYQSGPVSPQLGNGQQSVYQGDHISNNTTSTNQFEGNAYSSSNIQSSPVSISYSPPRVSSMQQNSSSTMSRLRAVSAATFPTGLDLRNQYRGLPGPQATQHTITSNQRSNSFGSVFTTGFPSAPLTAPIDFLLSKTTAETVQTTRDFPFPQLSAPMAPPQDFASAYATSLSPGRVHKSERNFGNNARSGDPVGQRLGQIHEQQSPPIIKEEPNFSASLDYGMGQKRKRGFTMPGSFQGLS